MVVAAVKERALQDIAFEPVVEQLGHRHRQQAHQVLHALPPQPAQPESKSQIDQARRGLDVQAFEQLGERCHALAEARPAFGVARADAPDGLDAARHVPRELQHAVVTERHAQPRIGQSDGEGAERQLAHELRRHPTDRAPARRVLLKDRDAVARTRQKIRRNQGVRLRADDDDVAQARLPRISNAALRPEAPITPPPGCVPEPHW